MGTDSSRLLDDSVRGDALKGPQFKVRSRSPRSASAAPAQSLPHEEVINDPFPRTHAMRCGNLLSSSLEGPAF